MAHSSLAVANEFLQRAHESHAELTHMQLQKLVYLAHGWNLAVNGSPLIEDRFEAWDFGPVSRRLYDALKKWGRDAIRKSIKWGDDTPFISDDDGTAKADVSPKEKAVIDKVWKLYGRFEAFQLSALTHEEGSPWCQSYERGKNRPIDNNSIRTYFVKLATAR